MSEKYIRKNKNSFSIVKGSRTYGKTNNLDDAVFIRDFLAENDWDLSKLPKTIENDGNYMVLSVLDEKIFVIAKYKEKPSDETIERLIKRYRRNPNNSRYGLNITKVFDTFVIKKQIFGDDYIFGYYDRLEDAQFVRNFLLDNNWNINELKEIEFDEETDTYKVISVIDDAAYVLDSSTTDDIDLDKAYEEFLSKIYKQKYGLASYPHLDLLTDKIEELEERFSVRARDDAWSFASDVSSPLNEIIFSLTPFQQSVYDAISANTTLDEIEKSLIRYKSGNFKEKIEKNVNELIDLDLVEKVGKDTFSKTNL
ncbi:hypothetical protein [Methanobrevibacter sp.]|uniref:hypothetical protein n=1 Tax=Methanobrevibacter sp. TaxID=66852 RepID=UPI00388ECBA0